MFGLAAVCWAIWKARNIICFEHKHVKHPNKIIFSTCMFITYWAGLQPEGVQSAVQAGVEFIMKTACRIMKVQAMVATPMIKNNASRLITNGAELEEVQEEEALQENELGMGEELRD
jgi:hypothetical protein